MFSDFFRRLKTHKPQPLPEPDAKLAFGALLVRVAKADHRYLFQEIAHIDRVLAARFDLTPIEAAKLRATCEKLDAAAPDSENFTTLLRNAIPYDERLAIAQALWEVSLADGITPAEEEIVLDIAQTALDIDTNDRQRIRDAVTTAAKPV